MTFQQKYTEQQLLDELQRVAKKVGHSPTLDEFRQHGNIDEKTYRYRFDSWNNAKEKAGLKSYAYRTGGEKVPGSKRGIYREAKENGECLQCGEDHPACLVFHHQDPEEKEFDVSKFYMLGWVTSEILQEEIDKCDILCANCHRKLHAEEHRD